MGEVILSCSKVCKKCGNTKPATSFSKKKTGKYGVRASCKECSVKENLDWIKNNPEWCEAYQTSRKTSLTEVQRTAEKDRLKKRVDQKKAYYLKNKSKITSYNLDYAKRNPEQFAARAMHRLALKAKATPSWANHEEIKKAYAKAAHLTRETGASWHVDHIVPINSAIVCGMHVGSNLSVILASENIAKGNRHWPDMP